MPNNYFQFKQFTVQQDACAMKVTTDGCLFGAWCADELGHLQKALHTVLDIGTGTGLLPLMIAQKNAVLIDAVEIEENAAAQARANVAASPWAHTITVHTGNVLGMDFLKSYDVIISNPPFYEADLASGKKEKDTAHHSTELTLAQLLHFIKQHLAPDGHYFLLLPYRRQAEAYALLKKVGLPLHKAVTVHPTENRPAFRLLLQGGHTPKEQVATQLTIQQNGGYTQSFARLLQPYYLHF